MTLRAKASFALQCVLALIFLRTDIAHAIKIRVKGSAQVQAVAMVDGDAVVVRGQLTDDVAAPIDGGRILLSVLADSGPPRPARPSAVIACEGSPSVVARESAEEWSVGTDLRGDFCAVLPGVRDEVKIALRFAGTAGWEGTKTELAVDRDAGKLARPVLRFEPVVDVVDLDKPTALVSVSLRIDRSDASRASAGGVRREGLLLVLEDERGVKLAEAATGGDGRARFELSTADLGAAGLGELVVRFDATGVLARARASQPIVRRAQASLALARPVEPVGSDGAVIDVDVSTSRGPVDTGVVEAVRGTESVGAGHVEGGRARVVVAVGDELRGSVPVALHYVAAAPWYRPGDALEVLVAAAGPGILRELLLASLVAGVVAWIVAGWRRSPTIASLPDARTAPPFGRAGVRVLSEAAGAGWRGHVSDAHEAAPIQGAVLKIVEPGFDGERVVAEAVTDDNGAFALEHAPRPGARLVVESARHSAYEQALPPPGTLHVALVTRRRALVDRLVRWARRQGPPYDGPREPTPGHVRRVAARGEQVDIEAWAQLVERAAFGPDAVDARAEHEARSAEPQRGISA